MDHVVKNSLARTIHMPIITDSAELVAYEMDAGLEAGHPDGVVFPRTASEVAQMVTWASQHQVPLIARGAGTGTSGGAIADRGGVIVELARMNRIVELDEFSKQVSVEPGVINFALNECASKANLFYPPDPASGRVSTLGGNLAENAGGPRCFKYGVTTNYVTGLKAVLAHGRIAQFGGCALDYPGSDWVGVLTGSEGTLGIIVEANLRLLRAPRATTMLMAAFDSIARAGDAVSAIIARGLTPATLEMMDRAIVKIVQDYSHLDLPMDAAALLIVEVNGYAASLASQMAEITALLRAHDVGEIIFAETPAAREKIWRARKDSAGALAWLAPAYYASDCTVPRSQIAATLAEINRICAAHAIPVCYLLHAGDGNLHPNYLVADANDHELMARVREVEAHVLAFCVTQGGSITGEHGVGTERRNFMPFMYNADELQAMRDVKTIFDPQDLLNPGKIFPSPVSAPLDLPLPRHVPTSPFAPTLIADAADAIRAWQARDSAQTARVIGGGTKSQKLFSNDLILSTQNLRGVRAYAPADLYVTVGAGTPLAEVQAELARDALWVPLISPWRESTLGGIVSANFNAPLRMRYGYGAIRDLVLALTVVLPNGRILRLGRPVVKNVAGYDLPKLFVGARGTLGLIVELTLKLAPRPRARTTRVIPANDLDRALTWGEGLQRICLNASALLLCSGLTVPGLDAPYAVVYTAEGIAQDVSAEMAEARQAAPAETGAAGIETQEFSGSDLWATWLGAQSPNETSVRVGVAPRDLPMLLRNARAVLDRTAYIADLANGLLYVKGLLTTEMVGTLRDRARAARGYLVVLAAPTRLAELDRWRATPDADALARALQARWDPCGLFNPGAFRV